MISRVEGFEFYLNSEVLMKLIQCNSICKCYLPGPPNVFTTPFTRSAAEPNTSPNNSPTDKQVEMMEKIIGINASVNGFILQFWYLIQCNSNCKCYLLPSNTPFIVSSPADKQVGMVEKIIGINTSVNVFILVVVVVSQTKLSQQKIK